MPSNFQCKVGLHDIAWETDYDNSHPCAQIGQCRRCGTVKRRIEHKRTGEPVYQSANSCVMVTPCEVCGDNTSNLLAEIFQKHVWGAWRDEGNCSQVQMCTRCGQKSYRKVHAWGKWDFDHCSGKPIKVCQICGQIEYKDGNS